MNFKTIFDKFEEINTQIEELYKKNYDANYLNDKFKKDSS